MSTRKDSEIQYKTRKQITMPARHIHDELEILLVLSDDVECRIGAEKYVFKKDTLLLFNNMDIHRVSVPTNTSYDRYVILFKPTFLESIIDKDIDLLECFFKRPFSDAHFLQLTASEKKRIIYKMKEMEEYQNRSFGNTYGKNLYLKFALGQLLLDINSIYRNHHNMPDESTKTGYTLVSSIINYIHENLSGDMPLESIALRFFINKTQLCSIFKNISGMSPNQYIINCRIMKAKELLIESISVETVCTMVGYNSLAHFSRSFKQHNGLSPKKFALKYKR